MNIRQVIEKICKAIWRWPPSQTGQGMTKAPESLAHKRAKGFTLFTALVGVLLVVLGVMLAQSMSSTERSTTEIIAENRLDQEMIDAATLAQADSLQEFNFGLRSAMEKYFSHAYSQRGYENYYELESAKWDAPFEDIVSDFEGQHFGSRLNNIAEFTAEELTQTLQGAKNTPDFLVRIPQFSQGDFTQTLKLAFVPDQETGNIIEPIDCDGTVNGCQGGAFYVNLDFSALDDDKYESLPKIEVIKKSTCRLEANENNVKDTIDWDKCTKKIRIPIVPRAKVRVLVPLRIFKAITIAKDIANEVFDDATNSRLENTKLGVCDSKEIIIQCPPCSRGRCSESSATWYSCAPRKQVEIEPPKLHEQGTGMANVCIGHEADSDQKEEHSVELDGAFGPYEPYVPTIKNPEYDYSTVKNAMEEHAFREILVPEISGSGTVNSLDPDDFALQKFPLDDRFGNGESVFFKPRLEARPFESRSLGFDSDGDNVDDYSTCSKISSIVAGLVFEEKNPVYSISSTGGNFSFQVRLVKNDFKDFDFATGLSDYEEIRSCPSNENAPSCTGYPYPPGCSYKGDAG